MSTLSFSAAATFLSLLLAAPALPAQTIAAAPAPGMSRVRIVRISQISGSVQVDRGVGRGFEPAMENLPIVESSRVRTETGVAEIEFEDNSTLRVAPNTEVDFPELERTASGATVTEVRVVHGMVYASLMKTRGNDFTLLFGPGNNQEKLQLPPSSHIRLQVNPTGAELAVLDGSMQVNGADGPIAVPRKRTVSFSFTEAGDPTVAKKVETESFDAWDRQSTQYQERASTLSAFGNTPYSYGLNDMSYYGAFSDMAGCGSMWRPYFADAAWNPYANGAWAWYGGAGYSWVSPYPWGWTPYHSGAWSYCQGSGWGWMPGGAWNGLANTPAVTHSINGGKFAPLPRPPAQPPRIGHATLVAVNLTPAIVSGMDRKGSFVFRRDSAGLGIPRQGLGGLRGFSRNSLRHGVASTPVYLTLNTGNRSLGDSARMAAGQIAPIAIHRGFAPAPAAPSQAGYSSASTLNSSSSSLSSSSPTAPTMSAAAPHAVAGGGAAGASGGRPR